MGGTEASTIDRTSKTCPFSGMEFETWEQGSGFQACVRLDLKPLGAIMSPWPVPVCPDHGFPLFKESFSKEELAVLRPWVTSKEYESIKGESSYFIIGKAREKLGATEEEQAWSYLQASWQVEKDSARHGRYLEEALKHFDRHLLKLGPKGPTRAQTLLITAEIERLLERFGRARVRVLQVLGLGGLEERERARAKRVLELVGEEDADVHPGPECDSRR